MTDLDTDRDRARVDYDHHSPAEASDPWPTLARLRSQCPVAWTEANGGHWVVTRHAEVTAVLRNWQTFSSYHDDEAGFGGTAIPPNPFKISLVEMDPPRSLAIRELLTHEFSASRVAANRPAISRITAECIEARAEGGTIDLVMDLVNQVPAKATLQLIGMDPRDWSRFALPMHEICHAEVGSAEFEAAVAGIGATWELVGAVVDDRRARPRDDVVSRAANGIVDGAPLSRDEAVELVWTLIMGGLETVTGVLAYSLRYLSRNPAARAQLIADPGLIPAACDEFFRYFTPSRGIARTVRADGMIGDIAVRAGDRVLLSLASANHDEAVFDQPEVLDIRRADNRHLTFGRGVHRCVGDRVARAELEVLIEEVLSRIPDYQVVESETVEYRSMPQTTGFVVMPATFTARAPRPIS